MKLNPNMQWLAICGLLFIVSPDRLKTTLSAFGAGVPSIMLLQLATTHAQFVMKGLTVDTPQLSCGQTVYLHDHRSVSISVSR